MTEFNLADYDPVPPEMRLDSHFQSLADVIVGPAKVDKGGLTSVEIGLQVICFEPDVATQSLFRIHRQNKDNPPAFFKDMRDDVVHSRLGAGLLIGVACLYPEPMQQFDLMADFSKHSHPGEVALLESLVKDAATNVHKNAGIVAERNRRIREAA